jgi:hypothetical protein
MATSPALRRSLVLVLPLATGLLLTGKLGGADTKKVNKNIREIAGTAEHLRAVPKRFATLKAVDPERRRVTLLIEGDKQPRAWDLTPDAELKVAGWWGRLDDFTLGDRVWAWFKTNRAKQPVAIFMLADEPTEQEMHSHGITLQAKGEGTMTLKPAKGKSRTLKGDRTKGYLTRPPSQEGAKTTPEELKDWRGAFKTGSKVYVQSAGDRARLIMDAATVEHRRAQQKKALRKRWREEGLPGTVTFLHVSGEMDYMLDHEAMRWGRSLKAGDKVWLRVRPLIPAVVKDVRPWRERTQLRLVVKGGDAADLTLGQRVPLKMVEPKAEVDDSPLPPDLGRFKDKKDRVEWFLASIYCTCAVKGDGCTGQFYTLASCNPNACGMPNYMRKLVAGMIDKGMTDKQIFEQLLKEQGTDLIRPHLMP